MSRIKTSAKSSALALQEHSSRRAITGAFFAIALSLVLFVQGAIPFLTAPTLGQAVWTVGFAQSFANGPLFSIYAYNFGVPQPAPIAFGLAGAWPTGVLIRMGLSPIDAYTTMVAGWMAVAFTAAFLFGRHFSISRPFAIVVATTWGTMPVIWTHSPYSMLSLAIALLPLYGLSVLKLFKTAGGPGSCAPLCGIRIACLYVMVCVISVFMDGYTFVMFAAFGSIVGLINFIQYKELRRWYLRCAFPIHLAAFLFAYLLYSRYIGGVSFDGESLDYFRGWAVDVYYLIIPTRGVSWIMDALGLSSLRSQKSLFGDWSVWTTTFSTPVIVGAIFAVWHLRRNRRQVSPFIICMIFALYMALGPSLKVNAKKTVESADMQTMSAEHAILPTGAGLLYGHVPGLRNMRACYRWVALFTFCAWGLASSALASDRKRGQASMAAILAGIIMANVPTMPTKLEEYIRNRRAFFEMEQDLVDDMAEVLGEGERVAFLPFRNDFLVNYIVSKLSVSSYNIGGDKNLAIARRKWPVVMSRFKMGTVDKDFAERITELLQSGEVDQVILPYIDLLWAAHKWPYPIEFKEELEAVVSGLRAREGLNVIEREFYASVQRVHPTAANDQH